MSLIQTLCQMQGAKIAHKLLVFLESSDLLGTQLTQSELLPSDADVLEIMQHDAISVHKLANSLNYRMIQSFHKYLEHLVEPKNRERIKTEIICNLELNNTNAEKTIYRITFNGRSYKRFNAKEIENLSENIVDFEAEYLELELDHQLVSSFDINLQLMEKMLEIDNSLLPINPTGKNGYVINLMAHPEAKKFIRVLSDFNTTWKKILKREKPCYLHVFFENSTF